MLRERSTAARWGGCDLEIAGAKHAWEMVAILLDDVIERDDGIEAHRFFSGGDRIR